MIDKDCETASEKVRNDNAKLLSEFKLWLEKKSLSNKVINRHISNVDFYINDYLLYSDIIQAKDGAIEINGFFGDWFIRKAMWASATAIKSTAASLKKFYNFMYEKKLVEGFDVDFLSFTIKENMTEWLEQLEFFDSENEGW